MHSLKLRDRYVNSPWLQGILQSVTYLIYGFLSTFIKKRLLWPSMCKSVGKLLLISCATDSNVCYRHGSSVGIVAVTARTTWDRLRAVLSIALQTDLLIPSELLHMGAVIPFCGEKWPEPGSDPSS